MCRSWAKMTKFIPLSLRLSGIEFSLVSDLSGIEFSLVSD